MRQLWPQNVALDQWRWTHENVQQRVNNLGSIHWVFLVGFLGAADDGLC